MSRFPFFLSVAVIGAFVCGCSKPNISEPHPMSAEDISREAIPTKPPKVIEKRLIALNLYRVDSVTIGPTKYSVYVAETPAESVEGLTNVEPTDLPPRRGMLQIFTSGTAPAVATDHTFIDLDVVYLNPNSSNTKGVVSAIVPQKATSLKPLPSRAAKFVLLLAMGEAARLGLKVGDEVGIRDEFLQMQADVNPSESKNNAPGSAPATGNN